MLVGGDWIIKHTGLFAVCLITRGFYESRLPLLLLLLGAAALATHAMALTVTLTVTLTVALAALAVRLATTTCHCGGLGARKYFNSVHWFYNRLLFFYG